MYYNAFETKENKMKSKNTIELQRIIALLQAVAKIPTRQSYEVLNWLHTIRTYFVTFFMTFSSLKVFFKKIFPIFHVALSSFIFKSVTPWQLTAYNHILKA